MRRLETHLQLFASLDLIHALIKYVVFGSSSNYRYTRCHTPHVRGPVVYRSNQRSMTPSPELLLVSDVVFQDAAADDANFLKFMNLLINLINYAPVVRDFIQLPDVVFAR